METGGASANVAPSTTISPFNVEKSEFKGKLLIDELTQWVQSELDVFFKQRENSQNFEWPPLRKNKDSSKGDFTLVLSAICGKNKWNPKEFTETLAKEFQAYLDKVTDKKSKLIQKVEPLAGYLNIYLNRGLVFSKALKAVINLGASYGSLDAMKGKKVIVEHTSANPNGPLHIGNLRNVIYGGILANILKSVGYEVRQHFYVNDLGAQIGLTAIGFARIYDKFEPQLKIDQWIGMIYAIMNTFSELQTLGQNLIELDATITRGEDPVAKAKALNKDVNETKLQEYIPIFIDLKERQPELFKVLLEETKSMPSIKKAGGELNLRYENNDPEAVKIFRKMVISDLSGMQETLDTYNIRHDKFDFESELGWEGSNDRVSTIMKASPYFIPPTQCNDKGVPEGGYFNLDQFIKDRKLPQGKRGYQPDYPPLYIFRPDGSTLYSFRDVVYSLKKVGNADMVLNIIASEQNIAQEKVALGLQLLQPDAPRKQFHVSYELVKLLNDKGEEVKMSSRRGRYVLADDLFEELKKQIREIMIAKFTEKGKTEDPTLFENVMNEVSSAAMKYALVSLSCRSKINFSMKKVCDFEDSSAPFLLYNGTRFFSLFRKYEDGVKDKVYPPLPKSLDEINWDLLSEQFEWELFFEYILAFPTLIEHIACPEIPETPALPEFPVHLLCDFLISLVRHFSKYWSAVKILKENPTKEEAATLYARLYLLKALQLVLNNGLQMLTMTPLQRM